MRPSYRAAAFLLLSGFATAEVARVEVQSRKDEGTHERIVGRVFFAIDPKSPANQTIADLSLAPLNPQGKIEFSGDLLLFRPKASSKNRKTVFFEIVNRGGPQALAILSDARGGGRAPESWDLGDRYLLEQGFTVAFLGWQFDLTKSQGLTFQAPVAHVQGVVRESYIDTEPDHRVAFALNYCTSDPADSTARLTFHSHIDDPVKEIPRSNWRFVNSGCAVVRDQSLGPGLYEVVYQAKDSPLAGLGLAAIRDFASYLKHESPASPEKIIGYGYSQSARFLRQFLRDGFNADEHGRQVFDGMMIASAGAGAGSFNHRFAIPGNAGNSVLSILRPVDIPPFLDSALLEPSEREHAVPKIFYTFTSTEYWARAGSLTHTTDDGKSDVPVGPNSRLYFIGGTEHSGGPFPPAKRFANGLEFENYANFAEQRWVDRALLLDLDAWISSAKQPLGKEPPPSRYPTVAKAELVPHTSVKFPKIPGFAFPDYMPQVWRMNFGDEFESKRIIALEPPVLGRPYEVLVPQVDANGNDLSGVRIPEVAVPLGTHMGWNITVPQLKDLHYLSGLTGSFIPFPATRQQRERSGDSRLSIEERYKSREDYLKQVRQAVNELVRERFMLADDVPPVVERATRTWDLLRSR
jgi:hypothetical protein